MESNKNVFIIIYYFFKNYFIMDGLLFKYCSNFPLGVSKVLTQ